MADWQQIVTRYGAMVYTAAWRILRNRHEVEDVVQDVFLHAWTTRHDQVIENWGGWLRRLVVCRALDRLRLKRPTQRLLDEPAVVTSPVEQAEHQELQDCLLTEVAHLPDREREVFSLRYFEGLDNSEIASLLHLTPSAVSTALNKARHKLSERLKPAITGDQT
jgi:RNA polymerase sigma-70 factor (ECF subfamily)